MIRSEYKGMRQSDLRGPTSDIARLIWRDELPFWEHESGLLLPAIMGAADKPFRLGPVALTTTLTTNIFNPPVQAAAGVGIGAQNIRAVFRKFRITNKHATIAATFNLYIGATGANAAGTEIAFTKPVPVGDSVDLWGPFYFEPADFLVGGSNTTLALTIEGDGVLSVV